MLMRTTASLHRAERDPNKTWLKTIALICVVGTIVALAVASFSLFGRRTIESHLIEDGAAVAAVITFLVTYAVVAIGKLPNFHLDRAGAALLGASLMLATGLLSLDDAYRTIDIDTIALLLGMMIIVAICGSPDFSGSSITGS